MVLGGILPDTPAVYVVVTVVATALIWVGSGWVESSAEELSAYYRAPHKSRLGGGSGGIKLPGAGQRCVHGLGRSVRYGCGSVGSAIFNILVVPSLAGIATGEPVDANRTIVHKEAEFYRLFDSGSTTRQVAKHIEASRSFMAITNSPHSRSSSETTISR
jgi:cation:H+ antiporter